MIKLTYFEIKQFFGHEFKRQSPEIHQKIYQQNKVWILLELKIIFNHFIKTLKLIFVVICSVYIFHCVLKLQYVRILVKTIKKNAKISTEREETAVLKL